MNEKLHIEKEIQELAPELAKFRKQDRPKIDSNYFSVMQDKVMASIHVQEDAPANQYFETMQDSVISKVMANKKKSKVISLTPILKWTAAASIVMLMVWLPYNYFTTTSQINSYTNLQELKIESDQELYYLVEYLNTESDFDYMQSIASEEIIPNIDLTATNEQMDLNDELTEEDIEILMEM